MVRRKSDRIAAFGILLAVVAVVASGCGPGDDGEKVRPDPTTPAVVSPLPETTEESDARAAGEPFTYGDDAALDSLWDACGGGDANACSDLYFESPFDSDYETFGATCGQTAEWGECALPDDQGSPDTGGGTSGEDTGGEAGVIPDPNSGPVSSTGWWVRAEEACSGVWTTRGRAEEALSGDYHDDMMFYYSWLADLLGRGAAELSTIGGAPAEGEAMIQELSYLSGLFREEAVIESEHYIINQRQNEIDAETPVVSKSIQTRAEAGGAPTCGELTFGTSG